MLEFRLRFPASQIIQVASRYSPSELEDCALAHGREARRARFVTREQFLCIARWKTPRPLHHYRRNSSESVRRISCVAFGLPTHVERLEALTDLWGVQHRVASAILHLCHFERYPLMDVRAFWSLGVSRSPKNWAEVWPAYVNSCREIAHAAGVTMRTLDRALWRYAWEHGQMAR